MASVRTIDTTLGIGKESIFGTPVTPTLFLDYVENNLGMKKFDDLDLSGINGSRGHHINNTACGLKDCGGQTTFFCRPDWMEEVLEGICGGSITGTTTKTYKLGNEIPSFTIENNLEAKVLTLSGAKISRATFSSAVNRALSVNLDWISQDVTAGDTPTSGSASNSKVPFQHHQCALTYDSTTTYISQVQLTIDNMLIDNDFNNSQTRQEIICKDRFVYGSFVCKWDSTNKTLYEDFLSATKKVLTLSYSNGTDTLTFTMNNIKVKCDTPQNSGRGFLLTPCEFIAYCDDSNGEVVVSMTSQ